MSNQPRRTRRTQGEQNIQREEEQMPPLAEDEQDLMESDKDEIQDPLL